jgi:RimJ/RimL family protein N-acetyltransferase
VTIWSHVKPHSRLGIDRPTLRPVQALPIPDPPLRDGEVLLRLARDEDAVAQSSWGEDEEILRWTQVPRGNTVEAARSWIAAREAERRSGRQLFLTIADPESGEVLGACDLRRPGEDPLVGEVGFVLAAPARGRGVATRALRLLVRRALTDLGMRRVQALVHPDNHRSLAVVERAGFRRERLARGQRRTEHGPEDRVVLAVHAGEREVDVPPADAVRGH